MNALYSAVLESEEQMILTQSPYSAFHGHDDIGKFDSICRIMDYSIKYPQFTMVFDDSVDITFDTKHLCEFDKCCCQDTNQRKAYINLQCCGRVLCSDFFAQVSPSHGYGSDYGANLLAFCPFTGNGTHFIQFEKKVCVEKKNLMGRLNAHWRLWASDVSREEKKIIAGVSPHTVHGIHGPGCGCGGMIQKQFVKDISGTSTDMWPDLGSDSENSSFTPQPLKQENVDMHCEINNCYKCRSQLDIYSKWAASKLPEVVVNYAQHIPFDRHIAFI
jgi:hypothetical protein